MSVCECKIECVFACVGACVCLYVCVCICENWYFIFVVFGKHINKWLRRRQLGQLG